MSLSGINLWEPHVQISLDLPTLAEALPMAEIAIASGVDWLEVGTPLILGEGVHAVSALHARYPDTPIVADLKTMDGGYLEAEMMARAGASFVVVMAVSHRATIDAVIQAGNRYQIGVMGDVLAAPDRAEAARTLEQAGVDVVIAHLGFDERHALGGSPLDFLSDVVGAVSIPVQAVGGLSLEDLPQLPAKGAPLVVVGAPLVIDNHAFSPATERHALSRILGDVVRAVKTGRS
ncbi:MAG: orotidine 5'-phosphate decarboxylase [Thermaerobacter sp.]|nr:orotidine 5'-phosphate decarboxylase [Thermaerobacter sp.]